MDQNAEDTEKIALDSKGLDELLRTKCRGDCVVITNRKISEKDEKELIIELGEDTNDHPQFDELKRLADLVHGVSSTSKKD